MCKELRNQLRRNPQTTVYVDTCSIYKGVSEGCAFFDNLVPLLGEFGCGFVITQGTLHEINRHLNDGRHPERIEVARRASALLAALNRTHPGLITLTGQKGEFHDESIQATIRRRASSRDQVYITNDLANAWDVYHGIRDSMSVEQRRRLLVLRVTDNGRLVRHRQLPFLEQLSPADLKAFFDLWPDVAKANALLGELTGFGKGGAGPARGSRAAEVADPRPAYTPLHLAAGQERKQRLPFPTPKVSATPAIPRQGDTLYALHEGGRDALRLGRRIARGGEAFVFETDLSSGCLAKVYKRSRLAGETDAPDGLMRKIAHIVCTRYDHYPLVGRRGTLGDVAAFPFCVLVNERDEFVGYLMRRAEGVPLMRLIAAGAVESEFARLYPGVTKLDLVQVCISLLGALSELHGHGIVVGDLNANNVLVDPLSHEVCLIDADSYQYGNTYPCSMAVERYTAPEYLQGRPRLISVQSELFVAARIICETLMMVDNPYNSKVAYDPVSDMREGRFRYTFEFLGDGADGRRLTNREAPTKELTVRWSQLTRQLKNALGNTLSREGAYWQPDKRVTLGIWTRMLRDYARELQDPQMIGPGYISNDVFPKTERKHVARVECKVCGGTGIQEVAPFRSVAYPRIPKDEVVELARTYHFDCYRKAHGLEEVVCENCGSPVGYGQRRRDDGKSYYCEKCWQERECPSCHRRYRKWMLDAHGGVCGGCASRARREALKTGQQAQPAGFPPSRGESGHTARINQIVEALFSHRKGR